MRKLSCCLILASGLTLSACSGDDSPDASTLVDGGDGGTPDGGMAPTIDFEIEIVDGLGSNAVVGDNVAAEVSSDGTIRAAYGFVTPAGLREIHYAVRNDVDDWTTEFAVEPGANAPSGGDLVGLGFTYINGEPHITYLGGDDDGIPTLQFPTDLMLATKTAGGWQERVLVDTSAEAGGDCTVYCNFGQVVGSHPAMTPTPNGNGFMVVYRDTHNSFGVDDLARSDFEAYAENGPLTNSNIDYERSAGAFGDVAFRSNGDPVVSYYIQADPEMTDAVGVWAATYDGSMWTQRQISQSTTAERTAIMEIGGMLYLAFHDADTHDLVVAISGDGGDTWSTDVVEERGKTGLHPSITADDAGRPVVAYTYCGETSDRECPGRLGPDAEVRIRRFENGAWQMYQVDDGEGSGGVGYFTQVVVESDGRLGVFYTDDRNGDLIYAREQP